MLMWSNILKWIFILKSLTIRTDTHTFSLFHSFFLFFIVCKSEAAGENATNADNEYETEKKHGKKL